MDISKNDRDALVTVHTLIGRILAEATVVPETKPSYGFDPLDPRFKVQIGNQFKLTPEGGEAFYRLLDAGLNPHAAGKVMAISPMAAYARAKAYKANGGAGRKKRPL